MIQPEKPLRCSARELATLLFLLFTCGAWALPLQADIITSEPRPLLLIVEPVEGRDVVFQQLAPDAKGAGDQGRISILMRVFNPTAEVLEVDRVEILGEVVSKFDEVPQDPIDPGGMWEFQNCKCDDSTPLIIDTPFPTSVKVEVFFQGGQAPVSKTVDLSIHDNDGAPLGYIGRADDLLHEELWHATSHHPSDHQVFALDISVVNWTGSSWSHLYPGANIYEKESWVAYGMPIYAMADGRVCSAVGDHTEPKLVGCGTCGTGTSSGDYKPGGNTVFVQTGDEISLYAHLQPGSIPPEYLTPGAVVKRGAYLGKVGFSGATSGPHIHVHVKKEPKGGAAGDCDSGAFRPMMFDDISSLTESEATTFADNGTLTQDKWTDLDQHSFSHPAGMVYPSPAGFDLCTNCTDDLSYVGVWAESTEIDLRVKVETWDAFTKKYDDLDDDRFYLTEIDRVFENGVEYYIGLYRRGTTPQRLISLTGTEEFFALAEEQAADGFHLVDIDTFELGSLRQWVGVFHHADEAHERRDEIGYGAFAVEWMAMAAEGFALIDIELYVEDGQRHYFGLFRPDDAPGDQKLIEVGSWQKLLDDAETFAAEGFHLVDVESYANGNGRNYVAIFRPGAGTFEDEVSWDLFEQRDEKMRNKGFEKDGTFYRLIDIHVRE